MMIRRLLGRAFCSGKITKTPDPIDTEPFKVDGKEILTELPSDQLVNLKDNTTLIPGQQQKEFVSLNQFQKNIIDKRQFDLTDRRINLTSTGISDIMAENLTKIDLGDVSVKSKSQILLQDVDPNNIPEDLDIVFENKKKLTLVGKRVKKRSESATNMMKIQDSSFQDKSLSQFRGEVFSMASSMNLAFNRRELLRLAIYLFPLAFVLWPFYTAIGQLNGTRLSILEIEEEQKEAISKAKKYYYRKLLLAVPDVQKS